jgi:hypothetical protein
LPADVTVEEYEGQEPPVQTEAEPAAVGWRGGPSGGGPPHPVLDEAVHPSAAAGWLMFWGLMITEAIIGYLVAEIHSRIGVPESTPGLVLFFRISNLESVRSLLVVVRLLLLGHEIAMIVALFWVAKHARQSGTTAAPWILPIIFLQSIGLGLYLVGRQRTGA